MVGVALFSGAFGELPSGELRTGSAGRVGRGAAADDLAVVGANTLRSSGRWCSVTRMRTSAVGRACVTATGTSWGPGTSEPVAANRARARGLCAASDGIEAEPALSSLLRPSAPIKHDDRTVQRSIRGILDAVLIDIDDDPASNRAEGTSPNEMRWVSPRPSSVALERPGRVEVDRQRRQVDANLLHAGGDIDEREVSGARGRRASEIHETDWYVLEKAFPWVTLAVRIPVAEHRARDRSGPL